MGYLQLQGTEVPITYQRYYLLVRAHSSKDSVSRVVTFYMWQRKKARNFLQRPSIPDGE